MKRRQFARRSAFLVTSLIGVSTLLSSAGCTPEAHEGGAPLQPDGPASAVSCLGSPAEWTKTPVRQTDNRARTEAQRR